MGGMATCQGGACGTQCPAGAKVCGTACLPTGAGCEIACLPGFHACGDQCKANDSPQSCGTSCTPCAAPQGKAATCNNGSCGAVCKPDTTSCSGDCVDLYSSSNHCGSCGHRCPGGACVAGGCGCKAVSAANAVRNGGFDQDTTGWSVDDAGEIKVVRQDAADCPSSGALSVRLAKPELFSTTAIVCVPVQAGVAYDLGAWVKDPGPSLRTMVALRFHSTDCASTTGFGGVNNSGWDVVAQTPAEWNRAFEPNIVAPAGSTHASITFGIIDREPVLIDYVFLTPSPGGF
jgi:hypothetical protein